MQISWNPSIPQLRTRFCWTSFLRQLAFFPSFDFDINHQTFEITMGQKDRAKSDEYLAKPSGTCCLKGTIHKGESRGSWKVIADVDTYITEPPSGKANGNILLYFPDVWGMFPNGLLVMDAFADAGYLTLGLDYFRGVSQIDICVGIADSIEDPVWKHRKNRHDSQDPNFDYEAWKKKHTAFADVAVPKWVQAVREGFGKASTKYACVGYCFGAPYVCDELAGELVTAGAFAHPAFLREHHFANLKSKQGMCYAERWS